ncbi:hypothetical protein GNZ18_11035 [Actinomadura sp. NEAU-AAG5]|uniref:DUF6879 domain-containing protein n=1 Tax=Actinomadura litoris TaxID=2678616 RepID=A0A7K1KY56_9ACTN|nr:hypothetical protein [Actinomadura litoris]
MTSLDDSLGTRLSLEDYRADFRVRQWTIGGEDSWKLERAQHFVEPGFPSWDAFAQGRWGTALRLIRQEREWLAEFSARAGSMGIGLYRVRVVEEPITPYLQWELHLLRERARCGERIRVVDAGSVAALERTGPLPELLTLGSSTLYRIRYDEEGALDGAIRFHIAHLVESATRLTRDLFDRGEDLEPFFRRRVADLPPPRRGALTG